jgi:hypothetical protein
VAAWFAACCRDDEDGELWTFDESWYEYVGEAQWRRFPENTTDGSGDPERFDAKLTAFSVDEPSDWMIVMSYPTGFPRQNVQDGAYTVTSRFGVDHCDAIATVFDGDRPRYHRYVIPHELKRGTLKFLRERHDIWRGRLFPDSAGAAETARTAFERGGV